MVSRGAARLAKQQQQQQQPRPRPLAAAASSSAACDAPAARLPCSVHDLCSGRKQQEAAGLLDWPCLGIRHRIFLWIRTAELELATALPASSASALCSMKRPVSRACCQAPPQSWPARLSRCAAPAALSPAPPRPPVQATQGGGGWPMSCFLTPSLEPFFGGTYFPPVGAHGRPSFTTVLRRIAEVWQQQKGDIKASSKQSMQRLAEAMAPEVGRGPRAAGPAAQGGACCARTEPKGTAPHGLAGEASRQGGSPSLRLLSCASLSPSELPGHPS